MKLNLYIVYDVNREQVLFPVTAPNETVAIRENCHALYALNRDFESEFQLFHVGYFDTRELDSNGIPKFTRLDSSMLISWDSYAPFHEIVDEMTSKEVKALRAQQNGVTRLR